MELTTKAEPIFGKFKDLGGFCVSSFWALCDQENLEISEYMNKLELENLVEIRIKEAGVLLNSECFQGAYYLIGYALECAFKACISKQVKAFDFPDKRLANASHTHKLSELVGVAGLKQKLAEQENQDENFKLNWAVAKDWSEVSRYECFVEENKAKDLYEAITDNKSGILAWLKKYW